MTGPAGSAVSRELLESIDGHDRLPRGMLGITGPRKLLAQRSAHYAREPNRTIATDTVGDPRFVLGYGLTPRGRDADTSVEVHDSPVVWGGELGDHFGHFLTESATRLWPLLPGNELEGLPVVFGVTHNSPFASEWCEGFGLKIVPLPAEGTALRFTRMFVPERSWRFGAWIAPEIRDTHLHARAGMQVPPSPYRDVLWLSRSFLPQDRIALDECLLEWILADHVTPVHLETMSLSQQISVLESSRAIAGVLGSAFHALLMTEDTPDCLYLCSPTLRGVYVAQQSLLDGDARFAEALRSHAWTPRFRNTQRLLRFPAGFRVNIPDALSALGSTVLPELHEDPRTATFANPTLRHPGRLSGIDAALLDVMRDPLNAVARRRLGCFFEERGLSRLAAEQFELATDMRPARDEHCHVP